MGYLLLYNVNLAIVRKTLKLLKEDVNWIENFIPRGSRKNVNLAIQSSVVYCGLFICEYLNIVFL